jgi:hypothetical protein
MEAKKMKPSEINITALIEKEISRYQRHMDKETRYAEKAYFENKRDALLLLQEKIGHAQREVFRTQEYRL